MEGRPERICRVCGDLAIGWNFNGLTCSSCRVFFKRNAGKAATLKCDRGGHCEIASAARRSCTACRMAKCLAIGMELEKVMMVKFGGEKSGEGDENVDTGSQFLNSIDGCISSTQKASTFKSQYQPLNTTSTASNVENQMKVVPAKSKNSKTCGDQSLAVVSTQNIKKMRRDQFILDRLLEFSIRQQLSCCSCAPFQCTCALSSSSSSFSTSSSTDKPKKCSKKYVSSLAFNAFELNHLKELQSANGHLVDECSLPVAKVETSFENVVNLPVLYLKLVIKYCKALLPDFAHFSEACQMALLKAFFTDFIFIRIAFNYDPSSGEFRYISDETATSTILIKTGNFSDVKIKPILDAILAVAIEIGRILNHDTMLKDLFTALVFCQPQAAEVVGENREFLKYHYYKYSKLMQRYLEVKTGSPKAAQELHHLLLGYAHQMATGKAFLAAIFQEVGVANVHGILAEVYDLALGQTQQQQQSQPQQQQRQQPNTSENTTFD